MAGRPGAGHMHVLPIGCCCRAQYSCRATHTKLRNYIHALAKHVDEKKLGDKLVVFIDTNPALSVYTQIALVAMTELIIPVNADSYSEQVRAYCMLGPLARPGLLQCPDKGDGSLLSAAQPVNVAL